MIPFCGRDPGFFAPDARTLLIFLGLSAGLGGAAAFAAGRAIARQWRPFWSASPLILALTAGVRFLHYALFGEPLLSWPHFAADFAIALMFAWCGFYLARKAQMKRQYGWLDNSGSS